jgi:hypothetical protein
VGAVMRRRRVFRPLRTLSGSGVRSRGNKSAPHNQGPVRLVLLRHPPFVFRAAVYFAVCICRHRISYGSITLRGCGERGFSAVRRTHRWSGPGNEWAMNVGVSPRLRSVSSGWWSCGPEGCGSPRARCRAVTAVNHQPAHTARQADPDNRAVSSEVIYPARGRDPAPRGTIRRTPHARGTSTASSGEAGFSWPAVCGHTSDWLPGALSGSTPVLSREACCLDSAALPLGSRG